MKRVLSALVLIPLVVWLVLGFVVYGAYGTKHSRLR